MSESESEKAADSEIEAEIVPEEKKEEEFPWAMDDEERCRSFVYVQMTDGGDASQIDGKILVENMDMIYKWIRSGELPKSTNSSVITKRKPI